MKMKNTLQKTIFTLALLLAVFLSGCILFQNNIQPKEQPKEQTKEQTKEQPKEQPKEQTKEQSKEQPKEQPKEQSKEQPKEQTKEQPKEQTKEQPKEQPKEQNYLLTDQTTQLPVLDCTVPDGWVSGGNVAWSEKFGMCPILWYFWTMAPDCSMRVAYTSSIKTVLQGGLKKRPMLEEPKKFAQAMSSTLQKDFNMTDISVSDVSVKDFDSPKDKDFVEVHKAELNSNHLGERVDEVRYVEYCATYKGKVNGKDYVFYYRAPIFFAQKGLDLMATTVMEVFGTVAYGSVPEKADEAKKLCMTTAEKIRLNPTFMNKAMEIGEKPPTVWKTEQDTVQEKILKANSEKKSMDNIGDGVWGNYILSAEKVINISTKSPVLLKKGCVHALLSSLGELVYYDNKFNPDKTFPELEWTRLK